MSVILFAAISMLISWDRNRWLRNRALIGAYDPSRKCGNCGAQLLPDGTCGFCDRR